MFRALTAARTGLRASATSTTVARTSARTFSTTPRRFSDDHHGPVAPQLYGKGSNTEAKIPSDAEQATGIERLQLLGEMEGVDVFDDSPLYLTRLGTLADPIMVKTFGVS